MNQNRQKNKAFGNRVNNQNAVKKVRFDTSQQWRLSRRQIQANAPNRNTIQKNLSNITSGSTPLKRAQAAYYGGNKNRSPLLSQPTQVRPKRTTQATGKLPVHARLGVRTSANGAGTVRVNTKPVGKSTGVINKTNPRENAVQQLLAQKRALRLKTVQQHKKLKQLEQTLKRKGGPRNVGGVSNAGGVGGTLRSDQVLLRNNKLHLRPQRNNVTIKNRVRQNLIASNSAAADLSVSVANDFALQRQLLNGDVSINNRVNRRHLNRPPLHSNEINPSIQREISLIQERSRRMKMDPTLISPTISSINPAAAIHSLQTPLIHPVENPLSQLGGITTSVLPTENRPKLSLHERFSLL